MAALRQIAFYGRGGIGKSTACQNTLAALGAANTADPDLRSRTAVKHTISRLTANGNESAHPS
ncbi:hypothetical protein GOL49_32085 [Sinorhizobium medicae]|nr:hypothetical protein [Sinorhizobium medicae]